MSSSIPIPSESVTTQNSSTTMVPRRSTTTVQKTIAAETVAASPTAVESDRIIQPTLLSPTPQHPPSVAVAPHAASKVAVAVQAVVTSNAAIATPNTAAAVYAIPLAAAENSPTQQHRPNSMPPTSIDSSTARLIAQMNEYFTDGVGADNLLSLVAMTTIQNSSRTPSPASNDDDNGANIQLESSNDVVVVRTVQKKYIRVNWNLSQNNIVSVKEALITYSGIKNHKKQETSNREPGLSSH